SDASRVFDGVARRTRDGRFRFFTTEHGGPGAARNFAAAQSTRDTLLFFDADDLPNGPDVVASMAQALTHSTAACVTCAYDIVDSALTIPCEQDVLATYRPLGACLGAAFFLNVLGDATMIIARSVFEQLGGFPVDRASWEVHEFLLRLCFKGFEL